jgi:hypothetical protein
MTLDTLYTTLSSVYPTAYWSYPEGKAPAMPYMVYFETPSDNFGADNKVYHKRNNVAIELLTKTKDQTAESAVENALDGLELFWNKEETHLDDEDAYEVIYHVEV